MARYIKANPLVAKYLNLENDRNTVKDGNYILWQGDLSAFGSLTRLGEILTAIGAIALMPHEAREEQDGTVTRPLPEATDPRFKVPVVTAEEEITAGEDDNTDETGEETEGEPEEPGEPGEPETETTIEKALRK